MGSLFGILTLSSIIYISLGSTIPRGGLNYEELYNSITNKLDQAAAKLLKDINAEDDLMSSKSGELQWTFDTNITDYNKKKKVEAALEYSEWIKQSWETVKVWDKLRTSLTDPLLAREIKLRSIPPVLDLSKKELKKFYNLVSDMSSIYSKAKVCNDVDCNLSLEPELSKIFSEVRDASELKKMWLSWRHASGRLMKEHFIDYVKLGNKGAKKLGYTDMGEMWRTPYESEAGESLRNDAQVIVEELNPLYEQLHAYVRRKLREVYGTSIISKRGPIPAQLLGNMWSQTWGNIYDLVVPYKGHAEVDVTDEMRAQNYTARKIFEMADDFFTSMGMAGVGPKFWKKSILEKPDDGREVVCHASAWDFSTGDDFRIKQCTEITMEQMITAHHEMGHIQYYLQYKDQPMTFREGANPGFHEAVGDVIALSVSTPKHLHKVGLMKSPERTQESDINYLMSVALEKIAFLPFSYTLETWRWDVFQNESLIDSMNCLWWDKRFAYQGIKPASTRTEDDFDPAAKYHTASSVPYIRYLVANILQFQFYKSMCIKAGQYDPSDATTPLHTCDIYQSKEAGKAFSDMLKLGKSKHWRDAMEGMTGERTMSSAALREYFKPLEDWLRKNNEEHGEFVGWEKDDEYCRRGVTRSQLKQTEGCTYIRTKEGVQCV